MSTVTESLSPRDRARFLEAARVAGLWYRHNQNAPGQPWGGVDQSADLGRYLYEYYPATGQCRGTGVWSQAIASVALLYLDGALKDPELGFREAAERGIKYLKSLQYLDSRNAKAYGGFREHNPQDTWSYPRDGATGCFGLAAWARETGDADALERADLFCKWYGTHGSGGDIWPDGEFNFETGEGTPRVQGDWQAGGGLCYYYTARAAKDEKWIENGFRPMTEVLAKIGDPSDVDGVESGWHGQSRITVGNDDFATVALMAAFLAFDDEKFLDVARKRVNYYLSLQADDGSFPNYGGTFVTALTLLDFVQLVTEKKLPDDLGPVIDALLKAAFFGLSLQCREHRDRRAYGGLWGQGNYGVGRDRIHNRSTTYATHLWLRLAGHRAPCLSAFDW